MDTLWAIGSLLIGFVAILALNFEFLALRSRQSRNVGILIIAITLVSAFSWKEVVSIADWLRVDMFIAGCVIGLPLTIWVYRKAPTN